MFKSTLVAATAAAIALTSFDLRPAAAAPQAGSAIVKNSGADELSAARKKRRRGVHPGVPLAAFGAIVGTIAGIAAAERRREVYQQPYAYGQYGPAPGFAYGQYGPAPGYVYEAPVAAPYAYGPQYGYRHGYRHGGYGTRVPAGPVPQDHPGSM
jgi:hypothetical protein